MSALTTRSTLCNLHIPPIYLDAIKRQLSLSSKTLQVEALLAVAYAWPVYRQCRVGWRGGILCVRLSELLFVLDDGEEACEGRPYPRCWHGGMLVWLNMAGKHVRVVFSLHRGLQAEA